jgi:ligand-binding sensor domain-containing protein
LKSVGWAIVNNSKKINWLVGTPLLVLFSFIPAFALDPNQPASSFLRAHFTSDDNLFGGIVDQIVQTPDGFLWLITNGTNLSRFDGKRFYHFDNPQPMSLAVAPDGDLWAGTVQDLLHIPFSSFSQFSLTGLVSLHPGPGNEPRIRCLRFSKNGELWLGTADGLFRYEGDQLVAVGPRVPTRQITEAPDGHLLVTTEEGFIEFAGSEIVPHPKLAAQLGVKDNEILDVLRDSHGNTWYLTEMGVARETGGRIEKLGTYARVGRAQLRTYEDAQGTVWIGKDEGLFRATSTGVELVAPGLQVRSIYSDRDGTLWVGTNGDGLYRFKDRVARTFTTDDGLPNNVLMTVIATDDGAVWTGANCGGLSRFDGTHFQTYREKDGLLNTCVWSLAKDANGDIWVGTYGGGAFRFHNGIFTQYSKSQGMVEDRVVSIMAARDGSMWFGTRGGVSRLKDGQFRNFTTADGLSNNSIRRIVEDRAGVIWAGTRQGLDHLVGDRFENFASMPKTIVVPYGEDRDGGFLVGAPVDGMAATFRIIKGRADMFKELSASGMVETEQGELWFSSDHIYRVPPGSFMQPRQHDEPLDYEAFSADGLVSAAVQGEDNNVTLTSDGKLWVATTKGLAMIDLRRVPMTSMKPSIYLTDVTIGRTTQRASSVVVLPPGTNHVQIDFAAVEVSSPEKIRLQYRLDGVDSEWLDAGPNPRAIYNNIPAGTHALHIRACNRSGIWDRQGVVFTVTQQPYFYQTRWFIAAMFGLGLLLIGLIYRFRVRQISHRMSASFDERLAERTRVAREIHDTFLQTVQGSKMVADHALKGPGG